MSVGPGEGAGVFSMIDAVLAARVAWTTALRMTLMSMRGFNVGGRADGTWGAVTVGAEADKGGREDMTSDAWSHYCRGNRSCESDEDVMLVGTGRLRGPGFVGSRRAR